MQNKPDNDNTPSIWLGDLIILLCVFALGVFIIIGGAAFGIAHCHLTHCAGYDTAP